MMRRWKREGCACLCWELAAELVGGFTREQADATDGPPPSIDCNYTGRWVFAWGQDCRWRAASSWQGTFFDSVQN